MLLELNEMNQSGTYLLSFLEKLVPVAAQNAKKMEELIFEDASSAIMKARIFVEAILNEVFIHEEIETYNYPTLYDKISYLARDGVINRNIQQAFDTIRLSGNKAAHDGDFEDITEAFRLHKEMYKIAVWFYEVYSSGDKYIIPPYTTPKPKPKADLKELVNQQIIEMLGAGQFDALKALDVQKEKEEVKSPVAVMNPAKEEILVKDLPDNESYLLRELKRLKESSQEAIENANQFSSFKKYLHVDRKIQTDLEEILSRNKRETGNNLILLCGSVGDGKSHLLAYLKENKQDLISEYTIYNDATESFSPNKNAMETLEEVLQNFSDQKINSSDEKIILAINMGVLHNFIYREHSQFTYKALKQFVEESGIYTQKITTVYSNAPFDLLSFGDYHPYELTANGPVSTFYSTILEKICIESDENPFHLAFLEDERNNMLTMAHDNFKFLRNNNVQEQIVSLIIKCIVKQKLVISARAFLNFIADILIPDEVEKLITISDFDKLKDSLPSLLFGRRERSEILQVIANLDPINKRSEYVDNIVVDLNTLDNWEKVINDDIEDEISRKWLTPFANDSNLSEYSFNVFCEMFIRNMYLTNKTFVKNTLDQSYIDFMSNLYYFNVASRREVIAFYNEIHAAIFKWKGSPKKDYIFINKPSDTFRLAQKLDLNPTIGHLMPSSQDILHSFKSTITVAYHDGNDQNKLFLEIDYSLYSLLRKVQDGYRPNKKDEEDSIQFVEFIDKLMSFGNKKKEILVYFPKDQRFYKIKHGIFGSYAFEGV